jgi:hypothetical protein
MLSRPCQGPLTPGVHPGGQNIAYDLALVKLAPIPNLVRIGPTVCISILDTHTHTDSPLYIRYQHMIFDSTLTRMVRRIIKNNME